MDEVEMVRMFEQRGWRSRPGLADDDIARLEAELGVALPPDFRAFLQWSDGGEDFLGVAYVHIHSADELREFNGEDFREFFPGLVLIGGNGGLEALCLDYRKDAAQPSMVSIDLNNVAADTCWPLGASFTQAMQHLSVGGDPWPPRAGTEEPKSS